MINLIYKQKNRSIGEILFDYNTEPMNSKIPKNKSKFDDEYDIEQITYRRRELIC